MALPDSRRTIAQRFAGGAKMIEAPAVGGGLAFLKTYAAT